MTRTANPLARRCLAALAAGAILATSAHAQPAPAPAVAPAVTQGVLVEAVVVSAWQAFNSGGYAGLAPHVAALRGVMDQAPAMAADPRTAMTYGMASLMLSAHANEMKQPAGGAAFAQRGLGFLPTNPQLLTELTTALQELKRPGDALAALDGWLAAAPAADPHDRARVLRAKGFALVELNRLDEGERAYRDALKIEPGHKGAQNELVYIAGLKRGSPTGGTVTTTADKAAAGEYPDPPK